MNNGRLRLKPLEALSSRRKRKATTPQTRDDYAVNARRGRRKERGMAAYTNPINQPIQSYSPAYTAYKQAHTVL